MLGGTIYSDSSRSRSSTPTSTAPPSGGSARPANDVPAYINTASTRTPSHPPSMTSHAFPPYSTHGYSESTITHHSTPDSPRLEPTYKSMQSVPGSEANSPSRIRVQSLSHIQSLASEEIVGSQTSLSSNGSQHRQYEISSMPVTEIIEMVAGLLTRITTTNDTHYEHIRRHIPPTDGTSNLSTEANSVLAFHGKNVPSITVLSYLARIHKYCPTTYEVFLSLLVYLDRMTETINREQPDLSNHRCDRVEKSDPSGSSAHQMQDSPMATPPSSADHHQHDSQGTNTSTPSGLAGLTPESELEAHSHSFVVDSFNIHRLVIAGVTCASKFFSDVFYTNSRYAKVGGLPQVELNHLELQFLLLNDFRLAISVEELESYGTMLVEFYAREIVTQKQQSPTLPREIDPAPDAYSDAMYMRSREKPRDHAEFGQTPTPP